MSLYPDAILKLLPENETQPAIRPRAVILHSAGGGSELYGWWMNPQSKGLESHTWISWDGRVYQYIDTEVRADANGEANSFAISVETASTVQASEPWTDQQVSAIVDFLDWCCREHTIPRRIMAHKNDAGIGWHVMFGAPGPWTKARGKVCPGKARIAQIHNEIMPRLRAMGDTPNPPTTGDFLVSGSPETAEALAILRRIEASMPRKAFAIRDPRDARVWVMTDSGRWWVRNMDALSLLIWTGQVQGFGPEGIPLGTIAQIDGTTEISPPDELAESA